MNRSLQVMLPLLLLVSLLLVIPAVFAQDTFGLSQADYDLLTSANAATGLVSSGQFDFTLNLTISGTPDASGTLTLTGSGQAGGNGFQVSVNGAANFAGENLPLNAELRLVDDIIYVNATDPTTGVATGWIGMTLDDLGVTLESFGQSEGVPLDTDLFSSDALAGPGLQALAALSELDPTQFVSMSRLPDEQVAGQNAAHFLIELDIAGLVSSDAFTQFVAALAQAGGDSFGGEAPSPGELAAMSGLMAVLFQDTSFTVEEWVGLSDNLIHRFALNFDMNLDPSVMGETGDPIVVDFGFDVTLSRFNEAFTFTAPPDAIIMPGPSGATAPSTGTGTGAVSAPIAASAALAANIPQVVQLQGTGPVDLTFTAAGGETVNLIARSTDGLVDTTIELLGPGGQSLAFNDDHSTARTNLSTFDSAIENVTLPTAGTYTIRVSSFSGTAVGPVEVTLETTGAGASTAPIAGTGQTTGASEVIQGSLVANGRFTQQVTLNAGEVVTITVRDTSGSLDPVVALLDSNLVTVAQNDDHGTNDPTLDTFDSKIQNFTVPATGTYTIEISDFAGSAGTFELTITRGGSAAAPPAPPANVEVIPGTVAQNGRFTHQVNLNAGEVVTITVRGTDGVFDPTVALLNANAVIVAENDDHGTNDPSLGIFDSKIENFTVPASGTYTIEISGFAGSGGSFELTIARR